MHTPKQFEQTDTATLHAGGCMRAIQDGQWLRNHLHTLTEQLEAAFIEPWAMSDAPGDYTDKMLTYLVGIEIPIDRLEGKWKVSQNRPETDRDGVANGLRERGRTDDLLMADLVSPGGDGHSRSS